MGVMTSVNWNEAYRLGLDAIDDQHASLFEMVERTRQAVVMRAEHARILHLLGELEHYVSVHFTAEEAFMQSCHYPQFKPHQEVHLRFTDRIRQEKQAVLAGRHLTLDLLQFLNEWLVQHILVEDKAYAEHVQRQGGGGLLSRFFRRFG